MSISVYKSIEYANYRLSIQANTTLFDTKMLLNAISEYVFFCGGHALRSSSKSMLCTLSVLFTCYLVLCW